MHPPLLSYQPIFHQSPLGIAVVTSSFSCFYYIQQYYLAAFTTWNRAIILFLNRKSSLNKKLSTIHDKMYDLFKNVMLFFLYAYLAILSNSEMSWILIEVTLN